MSATLLAALATIAVLVVGVVGAGFWLLDTLLVGQAKCDEDRG